VEATKTSRGGGGEEVRPSKYPSRDFKYFSDI